VIGCPNSFSNTRGTTDQALFSAVYRGTPRAGKPIRPCGVLTSAVTAERKLVTYWNQGERMAPSSALRNPW
jgi:hypothetical protein